MAGKGVLRERGLRPLSKISPFKTNEKVPA
jgi:hypothetical protein